MAVWSQGLCKVEEENYKVMEWEELTCQWSLGGRADGGREPQAKHKETDSASESSVLNMAHVTLTTTR